MVLRNYKSLKKCILQLSGNTTVDISDVKDMSGNNVTKFYNNLSNTQRAEFANYNKALRYNLKIALGTGTKVEDATDYSLDNDVTSSFTVTYSTSNVLGGSDTNYEYQEIFTITAINNSGSPITLTEVGIWREVYTTDYIASYTKNVLLLRSLLAAPVTVPANGTANILLIWKEG